MKKNHPVSESAFFNPRIFAAFMLCSFGAWIALLSFAVGPAPMSGTLSVASPHLTYTDPIGPVPNARAKASDLAHQFVRPTVSIAAFTA